MANEVTNPTPALVPEDLDALSGIPGAVVPNSTGLLDKEFEQTEPPAPAAPAAPKYNPANDQEMLSDFEKLGITAEDAAEVIAQHVYVRNVQQFLTETPTFPKTKEAADAMQDFLVQNNVAPTVENIKAVYQELSKAGTIRPRAAVSSGLSDHGSHELSEPDSEGEIDKRLGSMSLEDARAAMIKLMQRQQR
jgi:hypothetical protein